MASKGICHVGDFCVEVSVTSASWAAQCKNPRVSGASAGESQGTRGLCRRIPGNTGSLHENPREHGFLHENPRVHRGLCMSIPEYTEVSA